MAEQPADTSEPIEGVEAEEIHEPDDWSAYQGHQRLWLRSIIPLLQLRSHDSDPSCRVQFAVDQMFISACERITRILRSDIEGDSEQ